MQGSDHDESAVLARLEAIEAALAALTGPPSTNPPNGNGLWLLGGVESEFVDSEAGGVAHGGRVRLPDGREAGWQMSHATDELLDDAWADHEGALKALGHRHRLELLQDLLLRPQTALQLAESGRHGTTGQIYNHLRQLVEAGWLAAAVRGVYGVPTQRVVPLLVILSATRKEH